MEFIPREDSCAINGVCVYFMWYRIYVWLYCYYGFKADTDSSKIGFISVHQERWTDTKYNEQAEGDQP